MNNLNVEHSDVATSFNNLESNEQFKYFITCTITSSINITYKRKCTYARTKSLAVDIRSNMTNPPPS